MFGEITARDADRSLWSTSLDAFEEGETLLAKVESSIEEDPALEARISKTPAIAMRLDAARSDSRELQPSRRWPEKQK